MSTRTKLAALILSGIVVGAMVVQASDPAAGDGPSLGNAYHLFTSAYHVDENGVVKLPPHLVFRVETSTRGPDKPDPRILIRLHDAEEGYSTFIAQMDVATAAKLHHDLGELLVKKLQNPSYQQPHDSSQQKVIRTKRFVGIDKNGTAIVEDVDDAK